MDEFVLSASPNWYASCVIDLSPKNEFVYAARRDVITFDATKYPPIYIGTFYLHREKVTAVKLSLSKDSDASVCCSGSEDGIVKVWEFRSKNLIAEHSLQSVS